MWPAGWSETRTAVDVDRLAVRARRGFGRPGPAAPQDAEPRRGGQVGAAAPGDVIAVGVGDDRAVDRRPGIDVEVTRLAVEAAIGHAEEGHRPTSRA